MRRRITAFLMGAAVLTATLTAGQAALAAERLKPPAPSQKSAIQPEKQVAFPSSYPYTARVYTGNVAGASSAANKWMVLYGSDRNTRTLALGTSHFQNNIAWSDYRMDGYLGMIQRVCVYRDNTGYSPEWFLGSIQINGTRSAEFYQWIPARTWTCKATQAN